MAAIARRAWLGAPALALWAADARDEIVSLLGELAADLSSSNANGVMKRVQASMPERDLFEQHVRGLLATAQVATSIELRDFAATGERAAVAVDWFLEIRRDGFNSVLGTQRRRQIVKCEFAKEGKRWKLALLTPVSFFAPPRVE